MKKKEPRATQAEYDSRVTRYREVPPLELIKGAKMHLLSGEKMTVSFIFLEPNLRVPAHKHEAEQFAIILGGACDFMVEGKLYHLEEGDVLYTPSWGEHGNYSSDKGVRMIEVFSPPRYEYMEKLKELKKSLGK